MKSNYKGVFVNSEKIDDILISLLIVFCFLPVLLIIF